MIDQACGMEITSLKDRISIELTSRKWFWGADKNFRKEPYWVGLKYHAWLQSTLYEKTGIFADEPPCKQQGCVQPTW